MRRRRKINFAKIFLVIGLLLIAVCQVRELTAEYVVTEQEYFVQPKDTVWAIAERYFDSQDRYRHFGEFVHSIAAYNGTEGVIYPNQRLLIPLSKSRQVLK